jgi:hypothetical protein
VLATPTRLRRDIRTLTNEAASDLQALWREVETALAVEVALRDVLPGLVDAYGAAAATVAAEWYDDLRAEREVRGRFLAAPADIAQTGTQALVGWALTEARDLPAFKTLIEGGTQRRIANFARQTVTMSSIADPAARGWQRTGLGECDFCQMLIGRGAVYSEATADFEAHDHCSCGAEPAF